MLLGITAGCAAANPGIDKRDPQARCDELYEIASSPRWASLAGKTTREIEAMLGRPDHVWMMDRKGVTWMRIDYVCEAVPARATPDERAAIAKGWRFAPSVLFRNRIAVPEAMFDEEVLGNQRTAGPPPELQFREGGQFP